MSKAIRKSKTEYVMIKNPERWALRAIVMHLVAGPRIELGTSGL